MTPTWSRSTLTAASSSTSTLRQARLPGRCWCWCTGTARPPATGSGSLRRWPRAGHRVLAPSLPGHGASAPAPSYLMPDLAGWLGRFLDVLGVESAAVGGNSIGGLIPVHLALQQPQRVQRLLLIGGSAGFGRAVNPLLAAEARREPARRPSA